MNAFLNISKFQIFLISLSLTAMIFGYSGCEKKEMNNYTVMSKMSLSIIKDELSFKNEYLLAIKIILQKEWHTYWINPGDVGLAPSFKWNIPAGMSIGPIQFPVPQRINENGIISMGYHDSVTLIAQMSWNNHDSIDLYGYASLLVCKDVCIPVKCTASVSVHNSIIESKNHKEILYPYPKTDTNLFSFYIFTDTSVQIKFYHAMQPIPLQKEMDIFLITPGIIDLNRNPHFINSQNNDTLTVMMKKADTFDIIPNTLTGLLIIPKQNKHTYLFKSSLDERIISDN